MFVTGDYILQASQPAEVLWSWLCPQELTNEIPRGAKGRLTGFNGCVPGTPALSWLKNLAVRRTASTADAIRFSNHPSEPNEEMDEMIDKSHPGPAEARRNTPPADVFGTAPTRSSPP